MIFGVPPWLWKPPYGPYKTIGHAHQEQLLARLERTLRTQESLAIHKNRRDPTGFYQWGWSQQKHGCPARKIWIQLEANMVCSCLFTLQKSGFDWWTCGVSRNTWWFYRHLITKYDGCDIIQCRSGEQFAFCMYGVSQVTHVVYMRRIMELCILSTLRIRQQLIDILKYYKLTHVYIHIYKHLCMYVCVSVYIYMLT